MIKLTDLQGRPFWIKANSVTGVREPYDGEFAGKECRSVIVQGQVIHGVRETIQQVMGALGQV
jgi:uncharacterized protein YlzI (FlbEa/FlbD family)